LLAKPAQSQNNLLNRNKEPADLPHMAAQAAAIDARNTAQPASSLSGAAAENLAADSDTDSAAFAGGHAVSSPAQTAAKMAASPETEPCFTNGNLAPNEHQTRWCAEALLLDLKGPPRELAHNLALERWEGDQLLLSLDSAHAGLSSSVNQMALSQAWHQLGHTSTLAIELREGAPSSQTPAQFALKRQQLRQHEFESSVREHPLIASLSRELGAVIRPSSMVLH